MSVLLDAIVRAAQAEAAKVRTTFPGYVVSYDRTTQTADIQVIPRQRRRDPDTDAVSFVRVPLIPSVPVLFPSGNGVSITWDLAANDPVWVVLADSSIDEWRATGNFDTEAQIPRRWDFTDAVAFPGGRPNADPLPSSAYASGALVVRGNDVRLGSSAAVDPVALATETRALLDLLFTALIAWTPVPGDGGTVLKGLVTAALTAKFGSPLSYTSSAVSATKIKAE